MNVTTNVEPSDPFTSEQQAFRRLFAWMVHFAIHAAVKGDPNTYGGPHSKRTNAETSKREAKKWLRSRYFNEWCCVFGSDPEVIRIAAFRRIDELEAEYPAKRARNVANAEKRKRLKAQEESACS